MLHLTNENYYSPVANEEYMSVSQFKSFLACEEAAMAALNGEYETPVTTAMLIGSYIDAHFEGTLGLFKAQHPEILKRDGSLRADYEQANQIIARLENDELFSLLMSGRKQVIITGQIGGVWWKGKIDSLLDEATCLNIIRRFPETSKALFMADGAVVDLKIMRDLSDVWDKEERTYKPWALAWRYDMQGAVYQALDGRQLPFILAAGTKEAETDMDALLVPQTQLDAALAEIEDALPHIMAVKHSDIKPTRCGHCAWCRRTRHLSGFSTLAMGGETE